jgi:hypothetical protein
VRGRLVVLVDEAPQGHDPGVVDEHVERAELLFGAVQEGRERRPLGHVQGQGDGPGAELGGGPLGRLEVDVSDRHAHAPPQERGGRGASDAARGARDRGRLAGEDAGLLGHDLLLTVAGEWRPRQS